MTSDVVAKVPIVGWWWRLFEDGEDECYDEGFVFNDYPEGIEPNLVPVRKGTHYEYRALIGREKAIAATQALASRPVEAAQGGVVVAFRIVGRHGPYPWVDGKPDPEPEFIVGENERIEYAYAQPRPMGGVPDMATIDDARRRGYQDHARGWVAGWNDCRFAMLAAAPEVDRG
jgi:hypothetical protein